MRRYSGFNDSENGAEVMGRKGKWKVKASFGFLGWITRTPKYALVGTFSWTRDSSPTCRCANRCKSQVSGGRAEYRHLLGSSVSRY